MPRLLHCHLQRSHAPPWTMSVRLGSPAATGCQARAAPALLIRRYCDTARGHARGERSPVPARLLPAWHAVSSITTGTGTRRRVSCTQQARTDMSVRRNSPGQALVVHACCVLSRWSRSLHKAATRRLACFGFASDSKSPRLGRPPEPRHQAFLPVEGASCGKGPSGQRRWMRPHLLLHTHRDSRCSPAVRPMYCHAEVLPG